MHSKHKKLLHQKLSHRQKSCIIFEIRRTWTKKCSIISHLIFRLLLYSFKKRNNRILIEFFVCLPTNHLPLKHHFLLHPTYLIPYKPIFYPYNDLFFPRLGFFFSCAFFQCQLLLDIPYVIMVDYRSFSYF